jgi:hypothetical protein
MFTDDKINKVPLRIPLELMDNSSYQDSFSPNYSAAYFIALHFDTEISRDDLSLLLKEQDISIKWSLKSYSKELYSNVIVDANHVTLHLISGYTYTLDVYVEKGSQAIDELSPAIKIFISGHKGPRIRNELYVRVLIITCFITAGGLLLLSGLLYLLKASIRDLTNRCKKSQESTPPDK